MLARWFYLVLTIALVLVIISVAIRVLQATPLAPVGDAVERATGLNA